MILDSAWGRLFGPSQADTDQLAAQLELWIGLRRRSRDNTRAFYDLKGEMVDWSGPISAPQAR